MKFENDNGALVCRHLGETVRIESWGKDALRVRASLSPAFTENHWALTEPTAKCSATKSKVLPSPTDESKPWSTLQASSPSTATTN